MQTRGREEKAGRKKQEEDLCFKIVKGTRYLGGFIGDEVEQHLWVHGKTQDWSAAIMELSNIAVRYPQSAYAGLSKSLQQEWQFLQRVTHGLTLEFDDIESKLLSSFLPALFGSNDAVNATRRDLSSLPVKFSGLAVPKPTITADHNWKASTVVTSHLISALRGRTPFNLANHKAVMKEARAELVKRKKETSELTLTSILRPMNDDLSRTIRRGRDTGAWLTVSPSTINGTELSADEFRDALSMRYGDAPPNLPSACDGCGAPFTLQHALGCKCRGLIIFRHNELKDEIAELCTSAFTPTAVRDEPLIHTGREVVKVNAPVLSDATPSKDEPVVANDEERGDLSIRGFWEKGTYCIVDVRVTDTDAKSYRKKDPSKVLESQEKEKKKKYLNSCLDHRRHFTPFVSSVDGLLGREATIFAKRLAAQLSSKWRRSYSEVCGYVRARLSIATVRATHLCIRGSRVPIHKISQRRPQWEDGAGLSLLDW